MSDPAEPPALLKALYIFVWWNKIWRSSKIFQDRHPSCYISVTAWLSEFYLWPNIDMSYEPHWLPLLQLSSLSSGFCPCRQVPIRLCWQLQVSAYVRHKQWRHLLPPAHRGLRVTSLGPSCHVRCLAGALRGQPAIAAPANNHQISRSFSHLQYIRLDLQRFSSQL